MAITCEITKNAIKVIDTARGTIVDVPITDSRTVTEVEHKLIAIANGATDTAINFGGVSAGKVFFAKSDQDVSFKLNGSATGQPCNPMILMIDDDGGYTEATVTNASGSTANIDLVIAG